jgi:putative transcriptional regulator
MMSSLKGQFLVATPEMGDERFTDTVIYMIGHGEEGAMGLVVNKTMPELSFTDVLMELDLGEEDELIRLPKSVREQAVLRGGPVETGRGFVLHTPDYFRAGNSYPVNDEICLTATLDVLRSMAFEDNPSQAMLALGYCSWAPGQLEDEIRDNGWLTVPHSFGILFDTPVEKRYDAALASLGVNRASLSGMSGTA